MTTAARHPGVGDEPLAGLDALDVSDSRRIPILLDMVAGLSKATTASEVLRQFAEGFMRLDGPRGYVSLSTRGLGPGEYKITRLATDDLVEGLEKSDPWHAWSTIPVQTGGLFGRIVRHGRPLVLHNLDLRDDPVAGDALARYRSLMAIPLFDRGEPLNWSITLRDQPVGFTREELEEAILRSNLGGWAVKNAIVTRQLSEANAAIRHEVEQIAKIQRALLPETIPSIPGLEIGVSYELFDQAGGDMYTLRPLRPTAGVPDPAGTAVCDPNGPWGLLVADVSGHGPAAAVVMAMMQSIIDAYPREPAGPAEILEHANRHLSAKRIQHRFVTAFMAIYDPVSRRFTYARAGHNPPVWMRPSGNGGWNMQRLDDIGGIPLGIAGEVDYEEKTISLERGESLVLYTDGITEAISPDGSMFGVEGIEASLTECTGHPQCAIGHITETLRGHQKDVRPTDDQTLIVMQVV